MSKRNRDQLAEPTRLSGPPDRELMSLNDRGQCSPKRMIRLDQFLKLTGLFATGGQAKLAIQGGEVLVNGEVETRRRRQLSPGDTVQWNNELFEVELDNPQQPQSD